MIKFNESPHGSAVDQDSVALANAAQKLVNSGAYKTYGEALRYLRSEESRKIRFNDSVSEFVVVDQDSVKLANVAQRLVNDGTCKTYGEALKYLRELDPISRAAEFAITQ